MESNEEITSPAQRARINLQAVKLPKKRDVYESFMLKGLVPEMSYFTIITLIYSLAKLTLGAIYYNDCSLEPRLFLYLLVSSGLMLLYLPIIAENGQSMLGQKVYVRMVIVIQLLGLCYGSFLLSNIYRGMQRQQEVPNDEIVPKVTCNDVIFKFTTLSIGLEWIYIFFSFLARGFVTILFHMIVILLKNVFKMLFNMAVHDKKKEKTS